MFALRVALSTCKVDHCFPGFFFANRYELFRLCPKTGRNFTCSQDKWQGCLAISEYFKQNHASKV